MKPFSDDSSRVRFSLALCFFIVAVSCGRNPPSGEFGWARTDDRNLNEYEQTFLAPDKYRMGRENLYFFDYETIWWFYEIQSGSYSRDGFVGALYENNNTPEPVEINIRNLPVVRGDGRDYIRQFYDPLPPGRYLLRIAHKSIIVDEVNFIVVPPGGPAAMILEDDESETGDPIIKYSGL